MNKQTLAREILGLLNYRVNWKLGITQAERKAIQLAQLVLEEESHSREREEYNIKYEDDLIEQAKQEQKEKDAEIAERFESDHAGCGAGYLIAKAISDQQGQ